MDRRTLIVSASSSLIFASPVAYAGLFSSDDNESCDRSTPLDRVLCRQDLFINSAPTYITAGMFIGAALGVGLAVAARFHPGAAVAATIGGALLGGSVAGADLYIKYKMEEANGDLSIVRENIKRDIKHDYLFSNVAVIDAKTLYNAGKDSVENRDHALLSNGKNLGKTRLGYKKLDIVGRQIGGGVKVYRKVAPKVGIIHEPQPQYDLKETDKNLISIDELKSMWRIQVMDNA